MQLESIDKAIEIVNSLAKELPDLKRDLEFMHNSDPRSDPHNRANKSVGMRQMLIGPIIKTLYDLQFPPSSNE